MNLTQQMAYLKHVGELNNVKVALVCDDGKMEIHIHDHVFYSFETALDYLKRDAANVVHDDVTREEV